MSLMHDRPVEVFPYKPETLELLQKVHTPFLSNI